MVVFIVSHVFIVLCLFVFFNDKGNMEQTNQTSPARAKSAQFNLVEHLTFDTDVSAFCLGDTS